MFSFRASSCFPKWSSAGLGMIVVGPGWWLNTLFFYFSYLIDVRGFLHSGIMVMLIHTPGLKSSEKNNRTRFTSKAYSQDNATKVKCYNKININRVL